MDSKKLNYILGTLLIISVCFSGFLYGKESRLGIKANATKFTNVEVTGELQTSDLTVTDDVAITDDISVGGDLDITGALTTKFSKTAITTAIATTTLTTAMSGKTFVFTTSTTFVLPATSTASGVYYKFVVGGAITSNVIVRTSDLGNNIEGTLLVAGAVVDCAAEDTITFVADGENIGDFFEIFSDGTYWYIGASGALTSSKLTCTAS